MVERFNRTLKQMISTFQRLGWVTSLFDNGLQGYRTKVYWMFTKFNDVWEGKQLPHWSNGGVTSWPEKRNCDIQNEEWLTQTTGKGFQFIRDNLDSSAKRQQFNYCQGEWVLRWYRPAANKKLGLRFGSLLCCRRYIAVRLQDSEKCNISYYYYP